MSSPHNYGWSRAWRRWDERLQKIPLTATCTALFLLALAIRIGLALALKLHAAPRYTEFERIASSLALSGLFGNPYLIPTGPTAHHAPLYPLILSGLYSLFGTGTSGRTAQLVFNACVASLQYALLPVVAAVTKLRHSVGVLAGIMGALLPLHYLIEVNSVESLAATALMLLVLLTLRAWQQTEFSWLLATLHGLSWGAALLLAPTFLLIFLALGLAGYALALSRSNWRKHTMLLCCLMALTLLPWTVRNYKQFGKFFFVRNNLGLELSVSHNDRARAAIDDNEKSGAYRGHPFSSEAEALKVKQLGEAAYDREKMRAASNWIRTNPLRFLNLTVLRVFYFWFPKTTRPAQMLALWALTLTSIAGLQQLFRENRSLAWLMTTLWLSFPFTYYFLQSSVRYRFPLHWTFLLLSALAASHFLTQNHVWHRRNLRH